MALYVSRASKKLLQAKQWNKQQKISAIRELSWQIVTTTQSIVDSFESTNKKKRKQQEDITFDTPTPKKLKLHKVYRNPIRVIMIGGVPGVGKSTLVQRLLSKDKDSFKYCGADGLVPFPRLEHVDGHTLIPGSYSHPNKYGTDSLSYNCFEGFYRWLATVTEGQHRCTLLLEGDRFFSKQQIERIASYPHVDLTLFHLKVREDILYFRRLFRTFERGTHQSNYWLKGKQTKLNKVLQMNNTKWNLIHCDINTDEQTRNAIKLLRLHLGLLHDT